MANNKPADTEGSYEKMFCEPRAGVNPVDRCWTEDFTLIPVPMQKNKKGKKTLRKL